ncbi:unnamed protein product, partial [Thelazia callipaeda]|uniref:EB domain-containing protein n=1 Tax=Thelazia callipaeda TaxID=103827 RepID=A0A0N5CQK3_THECL
MGPIINIFIGNTGTCRFSSECIGDFFCWNGYCWAKGRADDSCLEDDHCISGLICSNFLDAGEKLDGRCVPHKKSSYSSYSTNISTIATTSQTALTTKADNIETTTNNINNRSESSATFETTPYPRTDETTFDSTTISVTDESTYESVASET